MKVECFSKRRQGETEGIRVEESGRIQGTRTAIEGVFAIDGGTRENFYGQCFWMGDPLEWPRTCAGSLSGRLGEWGETSEEGDEPSTLEKERKMASMQGNNILGEKEKEAKARSASEISGFDGGGTGPAGGLAADRRRRSGPRRVGNRLRNVGE